MASTNCLEAKSMQQIPIVEGEADENINTSAMEDLKKPKKVHQMYFVKLWPFKDPDEACKISEAEKLLEKLDQESIRANKRGS
ncbi:hypothetical protein CCACVL1_05927, partial [Corchorus capsularis]